MSVSGAEVCSGDRSESSRLFVRCQEKFPKILTDFGCSLESSGSGLDGTHTVVEVDWSGLAWKAGCRNRDVIMAVNAADMKVTDVGHSSLVEYLRDNGQTCSLLIKRDQESVTNFYWIAFHVKVKGREPIVDESRRLSVGPDINNAERVHEALPTWARPTRSWSSTRKFHYDGSEQKRLVSGESSNNDRYLGFFVSSGASEPRAKPRAEPKFTIDDFILNMHKYQAISGSVPGTVVAFSSKPRINDTEMHTRMHTLGGTLGCFDRSSSSSSVDEEDETEIDGEACQCLSGSTSGPLMLEDFPSWMTKGQQICGNRRMFLYTLNNNGTGSLSALSNDKLYVTSDSKGPACLKRTKSELTLRPGLQVETSSSIYPNVHDVES